MSATQRDFLELQEQLEKFGYPHINQVCPSLAEYFFRDSTIPGVPSNRELHFEILEEEQKEALIVIFAEFCEKHALQWLASAHAG